MKIVYSQDTEDSKQLYSYCRRSIQDRVGRRSSFSGLEISRHFFNVSIVPETISLSSGAVTIVWDSLKDAHLSFRFFESNVFFQSVLIKTQGRCNPPIIPQPKQNKQRRRVHKWQEGVWKLKIKKLSISIIKKKQNLDHRLALCFLCIFVTCSS